MHADFIGSNIKVITACTVQNIFYRIMMVVIFVGVFLMNHLRGQQYQHHHHTPQLISKHSTGMKEHYSLKNMYVHIGFFVCEPI